MNKDLSNLSDDEDDSVSRNGNSNESVSVEEESSLASDERHFTKTVLNNFENLGIISMEDDLLHNHKAKSDSTNGTFISLYLIIIAFFVVLNSISNQSQTKVNAARDSVTSTFQQENENEAVIIDVSSSTSLVPSEDEFIQQVKSVFKSLVGFDQRFPSQGGNVIKVSFKADDLFIGQKAEFKFSQKAFLDQISLFLKREEADEKREIEFVVYTGGRLPSGPKYWEDLNILRSGAFVHSVIGLGARADQLSIGVVEGDDNLVTLTFHTRDKKKSKQDLKKETSKSAKVSGSAQESDVFNLALFSKIKLSKNGLGQNNSLNEGGF